MENNLNVKDLYHKYEDGQKIRTVLKNINVEFERGKLYAIVGQSGSGKTTLLSLISGLDTVQDGVINVSGKSIKDIGYTNYRRDYVNVIFQSYNLISYMTGVQNIITAMDIKKVKYPNKKAKAYEILQTVGIDKDTANREINKISGGEQQRVAIARALVHDSNIILADEPTGNLDEDTEDEVCQVFQDLAKQGKCVIIVTHSKHVAKYADTVYTIRKGKIKEGLEESKSKSKSKINKHRK